MNRHNLISSLSKIEDIAQKHGGQLRARPWPPADPEDILFCERVLGTALPATLKGFLMHTGGISLEILRSSKVAQFEFSVFSIAGLLKAVIDLTDFFRMTGLEWYTPELARKYLQFSAQGEPDWRTLLDFTRKDDATKECPVICISVWDEEWMLQSQSAIASSFGEYLDKSIRFMIRTEGGFEYYNPPLRKW